MGAPGNAGRALCAQSRAPSLQGQSRPCGDDPSRERICAPRRGHSVPLFRLRRRYAVAPAGALLAGLVAEFWQPIRRSLAARDGKGFNLTLDYLPLNDAQAAIGEISDEPQAAEGAE
jgi:hypothetical protein